MFLFIDCCFFVKVKYLFLYYMIIEGFKLGVGILVLIIIFLLLVNYFIVFSIIIEDFRFWLLLKKILFFSCYLKIWLVFR